MTVEWMDGFGHYAIPAELAGRYALTGDGALDGTNIACLPSGGPTHMPSGEARPVLPGALQFLGNIGFTEKAEFNAVISGSKTELLVSFSFMLESYNPNGATYDNFVEFLDASGGGIVSQLEFESNYSHTADYPDLAGWFNVNRFNSNEEWSGQDEGLAEGNYYYRGILFNTWYAVEMRVLIGDGTTGEIELRVNGVVWYLGTGLDTQPGAETTFNGIKLKTSDDGEGAAFRISDYVIIDPKTAPNTSFPYPAVISPLLPVADVVGEADWTPSAGADNYAGVDEPIGHNYDTDYNESTTGTHKDRFTSSASVPESAYDGVLAVQPVAMLRDDADLGTRTARVVVYEGVTEDQGTTQTLTESSFQPIEAVFEVNPDTSAAWTMAEVEAAEFGIELVT